MKDEQQNKISDFEDIVLLANRRGLYRRLPRAVSIWLLRHSREHKDRIRELELREYGEAQEIKPLDWKRIFVIVWVLLLPLIMLVVVYLIYIVPQLLVTDQALKLSDNELLQRTNEARATLVQAIGGFILLVGLFFTWRSIKATEINLKISQDATTKNLEIAQEGLVTQRFSKAIELLGSDKTDVRLGGIYALERIARESKKDHWSIMEILTAFVRENAPWNKDELSKQIPTDIQAVLTVLGRRNKAYENIGLRRSFSESRRLDLHGTDLQGADLFGANLAGANLSHTNLTKSIMLNTNLSNAILDNADLSYSQITDSNFTDTNLSGAQFNEATLFAVKFDLIVSVEPGNKEPTNFEGVDFKVCSLRKTKFTKGNFRNAKFMGGSLDGAYLKGADFTNTTFDMISLNGTDLREVQGLELNQFTKKGVEYEKANLPANIQELLSPKDTNKQNASDTTSLGDKKVSIVNSTSDEGIKPSST